MDGWLRDWVDKIKKEHPIWWWWEGVKLDLGELWWRIKEKIADIMGGSDE